MAPKKHAENTKKAAGNAKKAAVAAEKAAAENAKKAAAEDNQWSQGAKSNAKKAEAENKKREAAAKKAEAARLLAEEEAALPDKPKGGKVAPKRPGIDGALSALNATGIDDALDALALTSDNKKATVDRHPERRFKAAYTVYKENRLPQIKEEHKGLRLNQMIEIIKKEFEKHPDNPFNQAVVAHNANKEDIENLRQAEKDALETRLAAGSKK